jgi:signal peptidase I
MVSNPRKYTITMSWAAIKTLIVDLLETFVIAGAIFVIIYAFLFRPFQVNGQSMFPTFHDKQYVLTNLIGLRLDDLHRGDVIVFKAPEEEDKDFIKRVIGLPGDSVKVQGGKVYVNNQVLDESAYLAPTLRTSSGYFIQEGETKIVPKGELFVLGDNRDFSKDSREFGFITRASVIGKSMIVYWPPQDFHIVKHPTSYSQ